MSETTKSIEERRQEVLSRQEEVWAELEELQEERRALAPEVADGDRVAEEKATEIASRIAAARERLVIYDDALEELRRREVAEIAAAEEERLEALRVEYDGYADRRAGLEEQAQEALDRLALVLDELEDVDVEQRWLSTEIGERLNESRLPTNVIVGNWLQSRLAAHIPEATADREYLKPLRELSPLDRRAMRPAELAEISERRERQSAEERREQERAEEYRARHASLMVPVAEASRQEQQRHEEEQVLPILRAEFPEAFEEVAVRDGTEQS